MFIGLTKGKPKRNLVRIPEADFSMFQANYVSDKEKVLNILNQPRF